MAGNRIQKLGDKIRNSPAILYFMVALIIGCLATVITSTNDFYTSFVGVGNLEIDATGPDPSSFETTLAFLRRLAIAAMPQVITIVTGYVIMALEPDNKRENALWIGAIITFALAASIDIGTGYFYYVKEPFKHMSLGATLASAAGRRTFWHALFVSAIADTAFSEIGSAFLWGMFLDLYPDAFKQWNKVRGPRTTPQYTQPIRNQPRENRQDRHSERSSHIPQPRLPREYSETRESY